MSEAFEKEIAGKTLIVNPAPYKDANRLNKAIGRALQAADLSGIPADLSADLSGADIGSVLRMALTVATSDEVEDAAWVCAQRAAYNGAKVNPQLFDDEPELRAQYYPIMTEVIRVNVQPFFGGLFSAFSTLAPAPEEKSRKRK